MGGGRGLRKHRPCGRWSLRESCGGKERKNGFKDELEEEGGKWRKRAERRGGRRGRNGRGEEEGGPTRRIFPAASSPTSLSLFLRDGDVLPLLLYGWFSMAISGKGGEEWTEEGSDTDSPFFLSRRQQAERGRVGRYGEGGGRGGGGM